MVTPENLYFLHFYIKPLCFRKGRKLCINSKITAVVSKPKCFRLYTLVCGVRAHTVYSFPVACSEPRRVTSHRQGLPETSLIHYTFDLILKWFLVVEHLDSFVCCQIFHYLRVQFYILTLNHDSQFKRFTLNVKAYIS